MEEFTYQKTTPVSQLETYEWDNIWWEHADDDTKQRILIIGDSISCGYRRLVNECLEGAVYVDGFGTSKAVDHAKFTAGLDYFMSQEKNCKLILFNNGLHGWHLDVEAYKEHYRRIIEILMERYPDQELALLLSTPTQDAERDAHICKRNAAVKEIAAEKNLDTVDLYTVVNENRNFFTEDGVHLRAEGYAVLAEEVADVIRKKLKKG